jgi:HEAT repeat protein
LLGRMGPIAKPSIPALILALQEDDDRHVRSLAALVLGRLREGDSAVTAALTKALKDQNWYVRDAATNGLLKIDPEAAAKAGVKPSSP